MDTDYVDIYIIHRFDYNTSVEETMEALDSLVKAGKVRTLGAAAMCGYQFHNMQIVAEKNGWTPFVSMQNHYNMLYREDERELIPICNEQNVVLTPYSLLAWQFAKGVTAPIIGATKAKYFEDAVGALISYFSLIVIEIVDIPIIIFNMSF